MTREPAAYWLRQAVLTCLYVAGGWIASSFVTLADSLVLIWPPTGLTYAALLLHGARSWPFIALGALLIHLLFAPVPAAFLPFSMLSNVAGGLVALHVARRLGGSDPIDFGIRPGLVMLASGAAMSLVGCLIGCLGLVHAGMVLPGDALEAALRWFLADLFGVVLVGPFALGVARALREPRQLAPAADGPGLLEHLALGWALLLGLLAQWALSREASSNALVLSFLPAAVLMWSALRMAPLVTAGASMIVGLVVAGFACFGLGGFAVPQSAADIALLLVFLSMLAVFPLTLAAATHESRLATAELVMRASTDRLTGLQNRAAFEAEAAQAIEVEPQLPLALAYIDLDQFKLVNDTLGHAVGDQFLRGMAGLLGSQRRPGDTLARLGGDEFAVLLPGADAATAEAWAQATVAAIDQYRHGLEGHVLAVTASIGLVPLARPGHSFQEVFARADAACSAAKELGGNRVQCSAFGDVALAEREAAMRWAMRLGRAVENEEFELYFQRIEPLRPLAGPEKIEILLRLREVDGQLLLPGRFIPAVERFSLSSRLDRHVFDRVLGWFEAHRQQDSRPRAIAINLSAASLADQALASHIEQRLRSSTLPPCTIGFEITETGAVRDLNLARNFIGRMRDLGCSVALDDFGAGYCSFAYLRQLPVDVLKIDGSFVSALPDSRLAVAVVRSMAEIAAVLGMRTVAECVESAAVRQCLIELGVDYAQGYALHSPQPLEFLLA